MIKNFNCQLSNFKYQLKKWLFVVAIPFAFAACSSGGDDDNSTTTPPTPPTPSTEAYQNVSQYTARTWDKTKRAGIFYEIFVRSYADSDGDGIGDLKGLTAKLDYLNEMGVAGIWLMPINPSPSYHGYDVEDYTGIESDYGTMADFDAMLAKAHSLGIKVILDFVINHTSKTHPWFTDACSSTSSQYRGYYLFSQDPASDIAAGNIPMTNNYVSNYWHNVESGTTSYKYYGMFSDWMPDLNYGAVANAENSVAFRAITDAAKFWLNKGVDGFRLDAVKHIYQDENSNENPEFLRKFYEELKKTKSDVYMVGEMFVTDYNAVAPYYKGCPALFNFQSWSSWLSYAINNSHAKWYPKDMINAENAFKAVRSDFIDATKLSNHDEDRARTTLGGDIEKAKMAAAVLLTSVGSPYMYYGEEIGMLGSKATGDENVREPFKWDMDAKDTYRTTWRNSTTNLSVLSVAQQKDDSNSIWCVYRKFIELRNTYPALATGKIELPENFDDSDSSNKNFMVFYRTSGSEKLLVIHNVSAGVSVYTLNKAIKSVVADTKKTTLNKVSNTQYKITMPAYSTIIFEM